jgi:hypothetical protein
MTSMGDMQATAGGSQAKGKFQGRTWTSELGGLCVGWGGWEEAAVRGFPGIWENSTLRPGFQAVSEGVWQIGERDMFFSHSVLAWIAALNTWTHKSLRVYLFHGP